MLSKMDAAILSAINSERYSQLNLNYLWIRGQSHRSFERRHPKDPFIPRLVHII